MPAFGDVQAVVDGRELEPPQPFERVMTALATLAPGKCVLLILPREPFPLYQVLAGSGYAWQTERRPGGSYEVRIAHARPA